MPRAEEMGPRVELAVTAGQARDDGLIRAVLPGLSRDPRHLVAGGATAREQRRLGVILDLHLSHDQGQDLGAEVDLTSGLPRCLTALDRPDRLSRTDDGLELVALVDCRNRL